MTARSATPSTVERGAASGVAVECAPDDRRVAPRIAVVGVPEVEVGVENDQYVGVSRADARGGDGVLAAQQERNGAPAGVIGEAAAEELEVVDGVVPRPHVAGVVDAAV